VADWNPELSSHGGIYGLTAALWPRFQVRPGARRADRRWGRRPTQRLGGQVSLARAGNRCS